MSRETKIRFVDPIAFRVATDGDGSPEYVIVPEGVFPARVLGDALGNYYLFHYGVDLRASMRDPRIEEVSAVDRLGEVADEA